MRSRNRHPTPLGKRHPKLKKEFSPLIKLLQLYAGFLERVKLLKSAKWNIHKKAQNSEKGLRGILRT